jgi:nitroreductase
VFITAYPVEILVFESSFHSPSWSVVIYKISQVVGLRIFELIPKYNGQDFASLRMSSEESIMKVIKSEIFSKPVDEIIRQRFSCRTYIERPLDDHPRQLLEGYLETIGAGPFGNRARFTLAAASERDRRALRGLGTYGFIRGATGFIIGAVQKAENNLEDYGYLLEKTILLATDLDLGTCWLGGSFYKSSFARKISAREDELVPAVVSVGYIAKKPRRIESLFRSGAGADRRLPWEQLFFNEEIGNSLGKAEAGEFRRPLEMIRLAPSASNCQPWRVVRQGSCWHFYIQRTPGYRRKTLVKLFTVADLQRIDMGIAMSHFELVVDELGLSGRWEVIQPDLQLTDVNTEYTISWVY